MNERRGENEGAMVALAQVTTFKNKFNQCCFAAKVLCLPDTCIEKLH